MNAIEHDGAEAPSVAERASFFRAGIALGLIPTQEAIRFADQQIERSIKPAPNLLDLSSTNPAAHLDVIDVLSEVAGAPLSAPPSGDVVRALLDVIRDDHLAERRGLPETIALVERLSHFVDVNDNFRWELAALADDYALVLQQIAGDLPTITAITREFLARFDGARTAYRVHSY